MANEIAITTAAVLAPTFLDFCKIVPAKAAVAITRGVPVYVDSNGLVNIADANGSGTLQVYGITLESVGIGQAVDVLLEGHVAGYDLSGMAYYAPVYLSDTAGSLSTAAGTSSMVLGRVVPLSDIDPVTGKPSKVLYFRFLANTVQA